MTPVEHRNAAYIFVGSSCGKNGVFTVTQHLQGNILIAVNGDSPKTSADVCDMHIRMDDKAVMTFRTLG